MTDVSFLPELLSASGAAAYDWDLEADHIHWFGAWNMIFDAASPPANSTEFYRMIHDDDRHLVFGAEISAVNREYRLRRADGRIVWAHECGTAEFRNGRLARQRGLLRLIEKQSARPVAREGEDRDELTGCFNRSYMLTQINSALKTTATTKNFCVYLVLGIDKMSFVNQAIGMEAGDGLLRGVARRLSDLLPPQALLGRVGGDLFGILLPDPLSQDFLALVERLLQSFRDHPVITSIAPLHITISIGGVRLPAVARSATEVMIFAEHALHDAHQRGHNLFVEYIDSPERMQQMRHMLELGERVKRAFKCNGLRLAFQPVVDSQSSAPLFYEALIRMFDNDGQMIPAAQFVPAVEQLGLVLDLDRYVLDLAVRELEESPTLTLAINISGLTAAQADWPAHVRRVLGHRRSVAERLIVEITETAAIVDVSETRRFVDTLRELGGRVALDDFGAGFTSIRHLRALAISIMKIDMDLLRDLMKNPDQQHLVRMLIGIARGLGLKSVAEGVESAEVAAWLKAEKADMMQGYYFGKPSLERPWLAGTEKGSVRTAPQPHVLKDAKEAIPVRVASSL
jgi:diguanylate cyclase (GGDEF)-like protein